MLWPFGLRAHVPYFLMQEVATLSAILKSEGNTVASVLSCYHALFSCPKHQYRCKLLHDTILSPKVSLLLTIALSASTKLHICTSDNIKYCTDNSHRLQNSWNIGLVSLTKSRQNCFWPNQANVPKSLQPVVVFDVMCKYGPTMFNQH